VPLVPGSTAAEHSLEQDGHRHVALDPAAAGDHRRERFLDSHEHPYPIGEREVDRDHGSTASRRAPFGVGFFGRYRS
jgi:hypothetical protein